MNSFLKYFFVVINLLFVLIGILCIGFILWIKSVPVVEEVMVVVRLDSVLFYCGIALGSLLVLLGMSGALGSCYEQKWILKAYMGITMSLISAEVVAIIYTAVKGSGDFVENLEIVWDVLNNETKFSIQNTFNCCGYLNASEWNENYPLSCFNRSVESQPIPLWEETCSQSVLDWFRSNIFVIGGVLVGAILFQVFQAFLIKLLIRSVDKSNRVESESFSNSNGPNTSTNQNNASHHNAAYKEELSY